jgi:hypothetical protein
MEGSDNHTYRKLQAPRNNRLSATEASRHGIRTRKHPVEAVRPLFPRKQTFANAGYLLARTTRPMRRNIKSTPPWIVFQCRSVIAPAPVLFITPRFPARPRALVRPRASITSKLDSCPRPAGRRLR